MSCNYAEGLSPYEDKGKLGLPEFKVIANEVSCTQQEYVTADPKLYIEIVLGAKTDDFTFGKKSTMLLPKYNKHLPDFHLYLPLYILEQVSARQMENLARRTLCCCQNTKFDSKDQIRKKCITLAKWIQEAKSVVVHTGAGISTTAGIPDFRGPNGVWTLEARGEKPDINVSFNDARPTETHMALVALARAGKIHHVISQNIDGLHLKSGLERKFISEVHGNMFVERCNKCKREWVRKTCVSTVGQKEVGKNCSGRRPNGLPCRGVLRDTILDWEHELPELDLQQADIHARTATLSICLGTTLQIVPAGNLPLLAKQNGGRLVICNLQPTKHDKKADLLISTYVDVICRNLLQILKVPPVEYTPEIDPTSLRIMGEWTVDESTLKDMDSSLKRTKRKRKTPAKYQDSDIDLYVETETEISRTGRKRRVTKVKLKQAKNAKIEVKTEESETGFTSKIRVNVTEHKSPKGESGSRNGASSNPSPLRTVCIPRPKRSPIKEEAKEEMAGRWDSEKRESEETERDDEEM